MSDKGSVVPEGENLRRAVRWLSEHAPITRQTINEAGVRFDLNPLEEEFLLNKFLPEERD
ncbi:MAG: hypothetical protein P8126_05320 [Gammaproteobacteria bacterium]|jgi:hypothetical protein